MTKQAAYQKRDELLFAIGYRSYADYLKSGCWKMVRKSVFSYQATCEACGKTATEIHHRRYTHDNLTGKSTDGLVAICHDCHEHIEFCRGRKRTIQAANAILDSLIHRQPAVIPPVVKRQSKRAKCVRCGMETGSRSKAYCKHCANIVFGSTKRKRKKKQTQPTTAVFKPKPVPDTKKRCRVCNAVMAKASSFKVCLKCREAGRNQSRWVSGNQVPPVGTTVRATSASSEVTDPMGNDERKLALSVTWDSRDGQGRLDR